MDSKSQLLRLAKCCCADHVLDLIPPFILSLFTKALNAMCKQNHSLV